MIRRATWIALLVMGFAVTSLDSSVAVSSEAASPPTGPHAAQVHARSDASASQATDYVVEIPADDDAAPDAEDPHATALEQGLSPHQFDPATEAEPLDRDAGDSQPEIVKERFPSGSVKIERQVRQDAQGNYLNHGPWKMWDERGRLVAQGDYDLGRRTGTWVRWYRDPVEADLFAKMPYEQFLGTFVSQATFKDGQLDGSWTIYDNQLRKISQWTFTAGKRHGASVWWYTNGRKMREAQFRDGEMDGYYLEWAPDGTERVKETYQSGRKLAEKITHYPGGQQKSRGMYLFASDVEESPDDWWNCKLLVTNATGKDEQHGPSTMWYPNGQRAFEGEYDHDVQVGQFTWWHANAQQALTGRYDHGKQQGEWIWWHANGQKSIQGHYAHGIPTGRWTWWKDDGKVAQSADLSNSEGVVIDAPRALDPAAAPRMSMPILRPSVKR